MPDLKPASRLRVERIKAGWGLKALADAVGLDRRSLSSIEAGRTKAPKLATRKKLAAALEVSEQTLFGKVGK